VTLEVEGPDLGPAEENLAVRAARAVLEATGSRFGVVLRLTKRIPVRAGLGGGSSDAAAALHAVNALAGNAIPRHELLHLAARLGADVAFFASGAPLALAWGRGERLFRLPAPPAAPALIAVPSVAVSTPDAYRWWDDANPTPVARGPMALDAEALATWGSIGRLGGNDFESPVFAKHPELRALYERLAGTGPVWLRLCGSGSAVAAVYKKESEREDAADRLGAKEQRLIATTTRATAAPAPQTPP
jgi:4-diphosphocytidyl-2-C-methyl-D-erythritol kinase